MKKEQYDYLIKMRDEQIKELKELIVGLEKSLDIASAYVMLLISDKSDRRFEVEKAEVSKLIGKVHLKMRLEDSKYIFELVDKTVPAPTSAKPNRIIKGVGRHPAKRTKK